MKQGIWIYCRNYYKAYTEDSEIQEKLKNLQIKGCHLADFIYLLGGKRGCFYVFPASLYDQVQNKFKQLPNEIEESSMNSKYGNLLII